MSKQKPKTGMARMMQLAMTKKPLVIASVVLSSLAAVASFIPYIAIYFIIRQILAVYPDLSALSCILLPLCVPIWQPSAHCMS